MTSPRTSLKILVKEASEIYGKMLEGRRLNIIRPSRHHILTNLENLPEEQLPEKIILDHQTQVNSASYLNFGSNRRLENILETLADASNAILYNTSADKAEKFIESIKYKGQTIAVTNPSSTDSKSLELQADVNFEACFNLWADKVIKMIKSIPPKPEEKPELTPLQLAEKKIVEMEEQITKITTEKQAEQKKLEEKNKENEAINKTLSETQKKLASAESLSASLRQNLQETQNQLKDAKIANEAKMNGVVFDLESKMTKIKDQKELSFKTLNDQLQLQQLKIKANETLVLSLKKEILSLSNEKSSLEQKIAFANSEFSTTQSALVNQTIINKNLEAQLTDERNNIVEKSKLLADVQKKFRTESLAKMDLETKIKEHENKVIDLNKQKQKLQTTCGDLHKKIASLEESLKKAKDDYKLLEDTHREIMNKQAANVSTHKQEDEDSSPQSRGYSTRSRRGKANNNSRMFTKTDKINNNSNYSQNYGGPATGPK